MGQEQLLNKMVDKLALKVANAEKRNAYLESYAEELEIKNAELIAAIENLLKPAEPVQEGSE